MISGNFIDVMRLRLKGTPDFRTKIKLIQTDYGKLRMLDTGGKKPVILSSPDGPNVIEHHENLIKKLSLHFRVICFEFPGVGFSYPTFAHDYSFNRSAKIILNMMDILSIDKAALSLSCSNGFYAIKAATLAPERFNHLFLSQTPSIHAMKSWTKGTIPKILTYPIIGQLTNAFAEKKLAQVWYKAALPKATNKTEYQHKALDSLNNGGCFCLSSLVQGLTAELNSTLTQLDVPSTQIWGTKDFSHRMTDNKTILEHLPNCEIIEFDDCGHFPELEATDRYVELVSNQIEKSI
jgi:pimeloyl-ACP methyl ester carboxylesterase